MESLKNVHQKLFLVRYGAPSSSSLSNKHHLVIMIIPGYMQHKVIHPTTYPYIALYVGQRYSSLT